MELGAYKLSTGCKFSKWCLNRRHIHFDFYMMMPASQNNAMDGRYIVIIAPPRQRNVPIRWHRIVGRVQVDPADIWKINRNPRMTGVGADQPRLSRRGGCQ